MFLYHYKEFSIYKKRRSDEVDLAVFVLFLFEIKGVKCIELKSKVYMSGTLTSSDSRFIRMSSLFLYVYECKSTDYLPLISPYMMSDIFLYSALDNNFASNRL